jgi:hypothetical protein
MLWGNYSTAIGDADEKLECIFVPVAKRSVLNKWRNFLPVFVNFVVSR